MRTSTTILITAACLLALAEIPLSAEGAQPPSSRTTALKEYNYSYSHFKIGLPSDWKVRNDPIAPLVAAPKHAIRTKNELPCVKVVVYPVEPGVTLKKLGDNSRKQWTGNWKIESDITKKVGANQARVMVLEQTLLDSDGRANVKTKMMRMYTLGAKNKYFVVSCASEPKEFARYRPLFEAILASFRPEKQPKSR